MPFVGFRPGLECKANQSSPLLANNAVLDVKPCDPHEQH